MTESWQQELLERCITIRRILLDYVASDEWRGSCSPASVGSVSAPGVQDIPDFLELGNRCKIGLMQHLLSIFCLIPEPADGVQGGDESLDGVLCS